MNQQTWTAVDQYLAETLVRQDEVLAAVLRDSDAARLPAISVTPNQGKFLMLLAQIQGAKNILEIGTLAGYSTIWLARALPVGGRVITLEVDAQHAAVARTNFAGAGLADRIDLRLGPALDTLPQLAAEGRGPQDFIFIDADKPNNPAYFDWALRLARPGTIIIVDNVIRNGAVIDAASADANVQAVRLLHERLTTDPRVRCTALQTVGAKGYDGFTLAVVNG